MIASVVVIATSNNHGGIICRKHDYVKPDVLDGRSNGGRYHGARHIVVGPPNRGERRFTETLIQYIDVSC